MNEEQKWQMIKEALAAEAQGRPIRPIASRRTLFGIKSSVEEAVEKIAQEDEERRRNQRSSQD